MNYHKKITLAMMVMDHTITRAASGEIAKVRRRRIHNLRQKDRRVTGYRLLYVILLPAKIGVHPIFFYFILL